MNRAVAFLSPFTAQPAFVVALPSGPSIRAAGMVAPGVLHVNPAGQVAPVNNSQPQAQRVEIGAGTMVVGAAVAAVGGLVGGVIVGGIAGWIAGCPHTK